jgi:hypothetical protein
VSHTFTEVHQKMVLKRRAKPFSVEISKTFYILTRKEYTLFNKNWNIFIKSFCLEKEKIFVGFSPTGLLSWFTKDRWPKKQGGNMSRLTLLLFSHFRRQSKLFFIFLSVAMTRSAFRLSLFFFFVCWSRLNSQCLSFLPRSHHSWSVLPAVLSLRVFFLIFQA